MAYWFPVFQSLRKKQAVSWRSLEVSIKGRGSCTSVKLKSLSLKTDPCQRSETQYPSAWKKKKKGLVVATPGKNRKRMRRRWWHIQALRSDAPRPPVVRNGWHRSNKNNTTPSRLGEPACVCHCPRCVLAQQKLAISAKSDHPYGWKARASARKKTNIKVAHPVSPCSLLFPIKNEIRRLTLSRTILQDV